MKAKDFLKQPIPEPNYIKRMSKELARFTKATEDMNQSQAKDVVRVLQLVLTAIDSMGKESVVPIMAHDFCQEPYVPIVGTEPDLIWSCEFVEHVEEQYVPNFLSTFSFAKKAILMTYATPGQRGYHHVNCQPQEYWIEQLASVDFRFDEDLTKEARSQGKERTHFTRKGLVFVPEISRQRANALYREGVSVHAKE